MLKKLKFNKNLRVYPFCCFLVLAISTSVFSSNGDGLTDKCKEFISQIQGKMDYGWIKVPLDWRNKQSEKVNIFFYTNYKNGMIPLVVFNGGPTANSHKIHEDIEKFLVKRNLGAFYFDQRGTGCSSNIDLNKPAAEIMKVGRFYGTYEIAHDAEAIRKKFLGDKKWKIFGQSFGGQIASRYLTLFPRNIMSVHTFAGTVNKDWSDFYMFRMYSQKVLLDTFEKENSGIQLRLQKAKAALSDTDCVQVSSGKNACGQVLVDLLVFGLNKLDDKSKEKFNALFDPEGKFKLDELKKQYTWLLDYFFSKNYFFSQSILRQETKSVYDLMILSKDCEIAYQRLEKRFGIKKNDLVISECNVISYAVNNSQNKAYELFADVFKKVPVFEQMTNEKIFSALKKVPRLKYFVGSAGRDPYDSHLALSDFAAGSSQIVFRYYPELGHGGWKESQEFWDDVAR
jgi:hypothetical protein